MPEKIFSGENSKKLWSEYHTVAKGPHDLLELIDFIYLLICKIQELEDKLDEQDRICKQLID